MTALRAATAVALALAAGLARAAAGGEGQAAPPPPPPPGAEGLADPVLAALLEESLAARPELRQAEATVRAERERVPQAGALPDPTLTLGIQNDGFDEIMIGKEMSSYWQVMLTQPLPWPGKRGLRADVARLGAQQADAGLVRARLTTEADVRRAYLALLLSRDRLALLGRLEALWRESAGLARSRYEAGEGAQSDVLRAQLEQNRLRQRRAALAADERAALAALNRLRGQPSDAPVATTASVRDLDVPRVPGAEEAAQDALARSPELQATRTGAAQAEAEAALARRERWPDLAVSAGVMPRGGLEPMWQASLSIGLPLWSGRKQGRAVAEKAARAEAGARGADAVEQILRERVAERRAALAGLVETLDLYRGGLLVQSRATADSTLAQYRVGRVTFASVLEANAGLVADEDGYLGALADAQRVAIAAAEVSLDARPTGGGGGLGATAMPGSGPSGAMGAGAASAAGPAAGAPAAGAASGSPGGGAMGGM